MKIKEHETKPEIKKPKVISPEKYDWIGNIEADGRRIARLNGKWILINSKDEKVSKEYDHLYEIETDGLRRARLNGNYFLLDKEDNKVSKDYDNIYDITPEERRKAKPKGKLDILKERFMGKL